MNKKQNLLIAILVIAVLGCVVPGLSTPTPLPPAPTATADNRLPTIVAETFAAVLTQTMQAQPPTPTLTLTPEPPTSTPTVTATPPIGSSLTTQDDKSIFFKDERGGYALTIPAGWLITRPNQPEYSDALSAYASSNLQVYELLKKIQNENEAVLRLFAVDVQNEIAASETNSTIKLILDETRGISFNSDQDMQAIADELTKSTHGLEVTSLDILITPAGMQFGVIESIIQTESAIIYEKRVYFKGKSGIAYAWLTTSESQKNDAIPAFDAIMDTVRALE